MTTGSHFGPSRCLCNFPVVLRPLHVKPVETTCRGYSPLKPPAAVKAGGTARSACRSDSGTTCVA